MVRSISFLLNGTETNMEIQDHWTLSHLLREELGMTGTKEGCGVGECGACTILVDDLAVNACIFLAAEVDGKKVQTIEGLLGEDGSLHPLQKAFVDNGGVQCGFCTPGMIMGAKALLDQIPKPSEREIRYWLAGNLCRCTGYDKIVHAVQAAADRMDSVEV